MKENRVSKPSANSGIFQNRREESSPCQVSHKYSIPQSLRSSAYTDLKENIPSQLSQLLDYKLYDGEQTHVKHRNAIESRVGQNS